MNESLATVIVVSAAPWKGAPVPASNQWLLKVFVVEAQTLQGVPNALQGSVGGLVTALADDASGLMVGAVVQAQMVFLGEAGGGRYQMHVVKELPAEAVPADLTVPANLSVITGRVAEVSPLPGGAQGLGARAVRVDVTEVQELSSQPSLLGNADVGFFLTVLVTGADGLQVGNEITVQVVLRREGDLVAFFASAINEVAGDR